MSKHDPVIALRHMLDHGQEAIDKTRGLSKPALERDRTLTLAIVRLLEIIGEAANRIPREVQEQHPEIAWGQLVAMRNRLIHGYDTVDMNIIWEILTDDLPLLVAALRRIIP